MLFSKELSLQEVVCQSKPTLLYHLAINLIGKTKETGLVNYFRFMVWAICSVLLKQNQCI